MALPSVAAASPGCDALNGTGGPSFASTGSTAGQGFIAGDVITFTITSSSGWMYLYDSTTSSTLTAILYGPGSLSYTVPADTSSNFLVMRSLVASTVLSWSCVSFVPPPPPPDPDPEPEAEPEIDTKDSKTLSLAQRTATRTGAVTAGHAYSSMIGEVISGAIGGSHGVPLPSSGGLPSGMSGLGMGAGRTPDVEPGLRGTFVPWVDGRVSQSADDRAGDWGHVAVAAGASYAVSPGVVVGAFGGYERLDFDQRLDVLNEIDGNGSTAGVYGAWLLAPRLRLDGGIAHTWLDYDVRSGTASGDLDGRRWLFFSRLSGDHVVGQWTFTPSSEVFWLRETQDAYSDSLGTDHAKTRFINGRANAGLNVAYALPLTQDATLAPFAGIYADYYFGMEDSAAGLSVVGIGQGWAARVTGGLTLSAVDCWSLTLGVDAGNLGGEGPEFWTGRLSGALQF